MGSTKKEEHQRNKRIIGRPRPYNDIIGNI